MYKLKVNEKDVAEPAKFELSKLLYYFGTMIVILAFGWFAGITWEKLGGKGIFGIAVLYMSIFLMIGTILWRKRDLKVPGGLFITMAVCMIPLAVYGLQQWAGFWIGDTQSQYLDFFHWRKGSWFLMEIATILGGCIALKFFRFPFITAPIYFALWFMSMDIVSLFFVNPAYDTTQVRSWISMIFGIAILIVAYITDLKAREDFAFWGYLFGVITFWTGLTMINNVSGFDDLVYLLVNIGLILLSLILQRTVFLVFGALGVLIYLSTIYGKYFSNSVWFPVILSLAGLVIVFVGIVYQINNNQKKIGSFIRELLPTSLQNYLPKFKK